MGRDAAWGDNSQRLKAADAPALSGRETKGPLHYSFRKAQHLSISTCSQWEKKKKPKRDKLFIGINIKENCKTQSGVTQLLLRNHLVIASGKILLFLISVQWNCWGWTTQGTRVCLPSRALSSLPTGLSYPRGELWKDTPLGNRKRSCTSLELKMQFKHTHGCAADRFKYLRRVHCYFYELVNEYIYILNIFIYKYYLHYYILYIYILFILYIY